MLLASYKLLVSLQVQYSVLTQGLKSLGTVAHTHIGLQRQIQLPHGQAQLIFLLVAFSRSHLTTTFSLLSSALDICCLLGGLLSTQEDFRDSSL